MRRVDFGGEGRGTGRREGHAGIRGYLLIVGWTIAAALFLKLFFLDAYLIPSRSMETTILRGDYILVDKFIYGALTPGHVPFSRIPIPRFRFPGFASPQRGDIIVFEPPWQAGENTTLPGAVVKRCAAAPGDTVYLSAPVSPDKEDFPRTAAIPVRIPGRGDTLTLTRALFGFYRPILSAEGYPGELDAQGRVLLNGRPATYYTVTQDYYYVLGDNRDMSVDSRSFGLIPEDKIIGKAIIVYWSVDGGGVSSGVASRVGSIRWSRIGALLH